MLHIHKVGRPKCLEQGEGNRILALRPMEPFGTKQGVEHLYQDCGPSCCTSASTGDSSAKPGEWGRLCGLAVSFLQALAAPQGPENSPCIISEVAKAAQDVSLIGMTATAEHLLLPIQPPRTILFFLALGCHITWLAEFYPNSGHTYPDLSLPLPLSTIHWPRINSGIYPRVFTLNPKDDAHLATLIIPFKKKSQSD